MKERLLDVIKWGLVLIIAGIVFYAVFPKYDFKGPVSIGMQRCNRITGGVDQLVFDGKQWKTLDRTTKKETGKGVNTP